MIKKLYTLLCAISLITALPTFGMESTTASSTTNQSTSRCDCCTKNINHRNPIEKEHVLNKLEGACSYIVCDACQQEITKYKNRITIGDILNMDEAISKLYDDCSTCFYFSRMDIDLKWKPITYPCDNCQQEKTLLDKVSIRDEGKHCLHFLCKECNNVISTWKKPTNVKVISNCNHCSYFYNQHKKQCWQPTDHRACSNQSATNGRASGIKKQYPIRILPDITDEIAQPNNPSLQNPIQPAQHGPAHQNPNNPPMPGNPPIPGNFVIDNKIKWLGAAGIAVVACYGVYKWWKGEEAQEKDIDDEQDWEKKEQTAEQV